MRKYVVAREAIRKKSNGKTFQKRPKIQRLVTPLTLQRKRHMCVAGVPWWAHLSRMVAVAMSVLVCGARPTVIVSPALTVISHYVVCGWFADGLLLAACVPRTATLCVALPRRRRRRRRLSTRVCMPSASRSARTPSATARADPAARRSESKTARHAPAVEWHPPPPDPQKGFVMSEYALGNHK